MQRMMPSASEITLDGRRRTSLAKVGRRSDTKYLAETLPDGTVILTPAVTIPAVELAALQDSELRARLEAARNIDPSMLRSRGSFADEAE